MAQAKSINASLQISVFYVGILVTRAGFGSILLLFPLYPNIDSVEPGAVLSAYPIAEFVARTDNIVVEVPLIAYTVISGTGRPEKTRPQT